MSQVRRSFVRTAALFIVGVLAASCTSGAKPARGTTTTSGAPGSTSTEPATTSTTTSTSTSVASTTSTGPTGSPTTTRATVACRSSYLASCGSFRWDPAPPANQPMAVTLTFSPAHPRVGETVTFHATGSDPDAQLANESGYALGFGDPAVPGGPSSTLVNCNPEPRGPWPPPTPKPVSEERTDTHAYGAAGTYTAKAIFQSRDSSVCGHDPYGSFGEASVPVTVG